MIIFRKLEIKVRNPLKFLYWPVRKNLVLFALVNSLDTEDTVPMCILCQNLHFLHTQSMEVDEDSSTSGYVSMGIKMRLLHICDDYPNLLGVPEKLVDSLTMAHPTVSCFRFKLRYCS